MSQTSASPAPTTNGSTAAASAPTATQIGWQFINQYYTFLNQSTEKLHRFYTKKSTFCHGTEGDDIVPHYGQQDIHNKIMSLGFRDPKAFVHHISAQSSQSGGIMIQVIGEMQNGDDAPWKKFTQSFFLAEQPNGYFVLNDMFMYLKEEGDFEEEDVEEETKEVETKTEGQTEEKEVAAAEPVVQQEESKPAEEAQPTATPEPEAVGEVESSNNDKQLAANVTKGVEASAPVEAKSEPEPEVKEDTPQPEVAPEEEKVETAPEPPVSEAAETPKAEPEVQEKKKEASADKPAAAPAQAQKPAPTPAPAAAAPPKPTGPPPPKTWASLAASSKGAWGTALASKEAASTSASTLAVSAQPTPAAASAPVKQQQQQQRAAPVPREQGQSGASTPAAGAQGSGKFPLLEAAKQVSTNICFVKLNNWQQQDTTPPISESMLSNTLGKYGEINKIDFVKTKACAFVEYKQVESARKAIIASLRTVDGGEGGIKIPAEGGGYQKIIVESRKEKEDRGKMGLGGPGAAGGPPGPGGPPVGQGQRRQGQGQGQGGPQRQGQGQGGRGGRGGRGGGQQGQGQNRQQ